MISAVVLTKNSAATLQKTLDSVGWCDEVIVVDDGSDDASVRIARGSGATVYSRPLDDDFAAQRNFGLGKANGEWVLFVDSDETVPKALADEITRELSGTPVHAGYSFRRSDIMWGRVLTHGEPAAVRLVRLAKRSAGKWMRPVHEVWQIDGSIGQLQTPLNHIPHQDVAQFIASINRYTTIDAEHFFAQGVRVPWWHIPSYPAAKFFINYVLRRGFLDGTAGTVHALLMAFHSFLTRAKLWRLSTSGPTA